jgi:hypothetical protein
MPLFPESATLEWIIGIGIAAVVVSAMVIGLIVRYWPPKER